MIETRRLSPLLLVAVAIAGASCGPEDGTEAEAEVASAQDLACYVTDTPEEMAARPSPLGEVVLTLGDQAAKLCYGRPSANERTVMGELVPFGSPWRMGANEATAIHLPFAAEIGGLALEPGSYSIFGIPGESEWEIFVNGTAERWGVPISDEVRAEDLGSFTLRATAAAETVETLTYTWEPHGDGTGDIVMEWESTRVEIPVRGPRMM